MQWGFLPAWAKDEKNRVILINVHAETNMEKITPTFKWNVQCVMFSLIACSFIFTTTLIMNII